MALVSQIALIVGLGNPGPKYQSTRHNVGFWFVDNIAQTKGVSLKQETKFHGDVCKLVLDGFEVWLLKPMTFMNRSGLSVGNLARFYKIQTENILVVHDELDLPPGMIRLKQGGGHAGHNGLRDIIAQLGGGDFMRLRVGIGRPGAGGGEVVNYVLGSPPASERGKINEALAEANNLLPRIVKGEIQQAMNQLHSRKPDTAGT